jgi:type I restriction enzyme S subunit
VSAVSPIGPLPEGWQLRALKEIATKIGSGATPRGGSAVYLEARVNYALIRSQCVFDRSLDLSTLSFIDDEQAKSLRGVEVRSGDLLLNITGDGVTFGRCCMVNDAALPAVVNQHVAIIRTDSDVLAPGYLLSYLVHPEIKSYVEGFNAGGSRRALTKGHIENFPIAFPPLPEQRAIAATLGALDDKIELNRRMNEALEAMAQALFRDWFVDFGPTRAKMAGTAPYLSPDLWSLFPDCLDDAGKPEGWEVCSLNHYATLNPESWTARNAPQQVAYVDLANTKWGNIDRIEHYNWVDAPSRARRILRAGDTIVGTVRPGNGSFGYIGEDGLTGSTGFAVLRPKNQRDRIFVWCAAISTENIDRLAHLADGGAYPAVRPDAVVATETVIPSTKELEAFCHAVSGNVDLMEANRAESRTLAQIRDLLLPRLMSGELRVAEAERAVEAVL